VGEVTGGVLGEETGESGKGFHVEFSFRRVGSVPI